MGRLALAFLLLAAALAAPPLAPAPAHAADTWTTPFPGVKRLYRTTTAPNRIHLLEIDLCHQGVLVRATRPAERGVTAGAFAQARAAELAVNGDFFSAGYATTGMAMGAGTWWGNADNSTQGWVGFGTDRTLIARPNLTLAQPAPWMRDVVGGRPKLVEDGAIYPLPPGAAALCDARAPRTAVGVSADQRTLYLAVVDRIPRSSGSVSRGMTCAELAGLMRSFGAHEALNLDGGGSSQMWVKGLGYVNDPSANNFGAGVRAVANHIAIQAGGDAAPNSCPPPPPPAYPLPPMPAHTGSSDIDGDGRPDACVRGPAGVRCVLGAPDGLGAEVAGPNLSDAQGWSDVSNAYPLAMGDIDGDGRADLCARANAGVRCWRSTGAGFGGAITGPAWSDDSGFAAETYYRTFRMADVDGDGRDDVCIRAAASFRCARSTGAGFGGQLTTAGISNATGFTAESQYATIRMGDVDGDGRADVCARTAAGMRCWLSDGSAFATEVVGPSWSDASGWSNAQYWRTIALADVDGDGRADLCARAAAGYRCHLATNAGFGPAIIGPALSNAAGWGDPANYETIRLADLDGDGDLDLCARADAGLVCWRWGGAGFGQQTSTSLLPDATGWSQERYYATIRLADVDGDGRADLCVRTSAGFRCRLGHGGGTFGATLGGPAWSNAAGYDAFTSYATLQLIDPPPPPDDPGPVEPDPDPADVIADAGAADAGWTDVSSGDISGPTDTLTFFDTVGPFDAGPSDAGPLDADPDTDPDADTGPAPDADTGPGPDTDTGPGPGPDTGPDGGPGPDPDTGPDADTGPDPDTDPDPDPDPDTGPGPDPDPDPSPDPDPDTDASPDTDTDTGPGPGPNPNPDTVPSSDVPILEIGGRSDGPTCTGCSASGPSGVDLALAALLALTLFARRRRAGSLQRAPVAPHR